MFFKTRRCLTVVFVLSLLIPMHIDKNGYAAGRPKIAFSSTRDGNSEIYVMDIDGHNHVRLTDDPAIDEDPSWSPDGKRIAFVSRRSGVRQIHVMDSDGQNVIRLTNEAINREPAWSPDGKKIAYTRSKGGYQIWVMDANGQNQIELNQIGSNSHPAWSPDGKRIAFVSYRHGGTGIYVMDENGKNEHRLTPDRQFTANPSWSRDGNWIAYGAIDEEHTFQIFAVRVDGSGLPKRLTPDPPHKTRPAWSPDGDTIAYTSWNAVLNHGTIHLMTTEGEHVKKLSEVHGGSDTDPDWFAPVGWSVSPAATLLTTWGKIKGPTSGR